MTFWIFATFLDAYKYTWANNQVINMIKFIITIKLDLIKKKKNSSSLEKARFLRVILSMQMSVTITINVSIRFSSLSFALCLKLYNKLTGTSTVYIHKRLEIALLRFSKENYNFYSHSNLITKRLIKDLPIHARR